eukprot:6178779-Pleurochrysis_carterae.AAC.2
MRTELHSTSMTFAALLCLLCVLRPGIGPREGEQVWEPASVIVISLQFGFAITVLVYATAHISGGHINCAVTYALTLMGKCHPLIGIFYFIAQMLGSIIGALFLNAVVSADAEALDRSSSLGANAIQMSSATIWTALLVEAVGTFLLVFVVFSTAVDPEAVTTEVHFMAITPDTACRRILLEDLCGPFTLDRMEFMYLH